MKEILFATGNSRKIKEASDTLVEYGISVKSIQLAFDEIQHLDPAEITKAKARAAYALARQPIVVSDTSWEIPALGGFPGGYMKDVATWFDAQDWVALMSRHADKTIYCHEHVAFFDGKDLQHFVATYKGSFVDRPKGRIDASESFERVVVLHGKTTTMAESLAQGDLASAGEVLKHWQQFGNWYQRVAVMTNE